MFLLPFAFKGKIMKIAQEQANKNLNAVVKFDDISLSMFKSFPKLNVDIQGLNIVGVNNFAQDTLIDIPDINLAVNLASLFGAAIEINKINVLHPTINVIYLKDGSANYDVVPVDSTATEEAVVDTTPSTFKLALKEFKVTNAKIVYDDRGYNMKAILDNLNFNMKGDLTASTTDLQITSDIQKFSFIMDGLDYMSKAKIIFNAGIGADLDKWIFTFKDNFLNINDLKLNFEGSVDISDSVYVGMDLKFKSPDNTFKSLLSLIPTVYAKDFEGLKTTGNFNFSGYAKGKMDYDVTVYPEFLLDLNVKDGFFQYPDLPKSVDNVNISTKMASSGGPMDNITVDVSQFHVEMAKNPLDVSLHISHPETDMQISGKVNGTVDFTSIKEIVPLDSMSIAGLMKLNVVLGGKMSSIENEKYEEFTADGSVNLTNFEFTMPDLPKIKISEANMLFSPRYVDLNKFDMTVGRSDVHLLGKVEGFVPYAFSDGVLKGKLSMKSQLFDANEFLTGEPTPETVTPEDTSSLEAFQIPENIAFAFNANIKKILYSNMVIENALGLISLDKGKLALDNLSCNMLGGSIKTTGYYEAVNIEKPTADFNFAMKDISVSETYITFNTVQKLAPIAKSIEGNISLDLKMNTTLDKTLMPVLPSINGSGRLYTKTIGIKGNQMFNEIADKFKYEALRNPSLNDVDLIFEIVDGNIDIKPFDTKIAGHKATIGGKQGVDGSIDYQIATALPLAKATGMLTKMTGVDMNKDVDFKIKIGGTLTHPKIAGIESGAMQTAKEEVKEAVKKELSAQALKLIEDARKKADELNKQAVIQADNLRKVAKESGDKLVSEADVQGKRLIKEAGVNPIKKKIAEETAKKMNSEAAIKAKNLNKEADDKANALVKKAADESKQIIDNAEKKANSI
jgi:hypothetical protein